MDKATLIGILLGLFSVIYSMTSGGGSALDFIKIKSLALVFGGGFASVLISYKLAEVTKIFTVVVNAFKSKKQSPFEMIRTLVNMSHKARREGLLSLESDSESLDDPFLKRSIELVVDGVEPEIIKDFMALELMNLQNRHEKGQGLFKTFGALFPAWGMIGTLIGLIILLKQLNDPSKIGESMSLALITTFYGSIFANFICIPISNKLGLKSKEEIQLKEMIIEGILSIQSGENPRLMEHRLKTFLSPEQKDDYMKAMEEDKKSEGEKSSDEKAS